MRCTPFLTLMWTRCILAIFLVFCVLLSGCVSNQPPGNPPGTIAPTAPGSQPGLPSVFIITPPFDGGILEGNVIILVEVTNFTLAPPGGKNMPGTGHLIYYRDVVPPAMEGTPALTPPGTYGVSSETTFMWNGIFPGTHTFAVQLVNADNTPLDPPMVDAIDVTAVAPEMIINP